MTDFMAHRTDERYEILRVEHLSLSIVGDRREIPIVKDASFSIGRGERWGIAGESGAGKSMMMKAACALLPYAGTKVEGRILYRLDDGGWQDLLEIPPDKRQSFVSRRVAVIFQDSIHALNPNARIAKQWGDTTRLHHPGVGKGECKQHLLRQMELFGIRGGEATLRSYPHQLSGGMRQRIAIAMALESQNELNVEGDAAGCEVGDASRGAGDEGREVDDVSRRTGEAVREVDGAGRWTGDEGAGTRGAGDAGRGAGGGIIVADEPTTSLDSVTQRSVVNYIDDICKTGGKTLMYVSHNLGILQYMCDHLMVLKDGCIIEQGRADDLFFRAQHPYTRSIVHETMKIMGKEAPL